MTGAIISQPPITELPPGQNTANPVVLPGVTYDFASLSVAQTWTALQTFAAGFTSTASIAAPTIFAGADAPQFVWSATGQPTNQKNWDASVFGTTLQFRADDDAFASANAWMTVSRGAGATVSNVSIETSLSVLPAANSIAQGIGVTQTQAGTIAGGTPFAFTPINASNYINVSSDTVNNGDGNERTALGIIQKTGGSTVSGQRSAFHAEQWLTAPTAPGLTELDIVGATLQVYGQVGNSGGNFIASNSVAFLSGTGAGGLSGHEIDIEAIAGSSTDNKFGLTIVQVSPDAVQGSVIDAGIAFYNNGTSGGWKQGIAFNGSTVSNGGVAIDMSDLTAGGPAYLLKGPGSHFVVDGNANIAGNTITLGTTTNPIFINGFTSGTGTFVAPTVLGSARWTLPTNTGTFVVTASAPFTVNAATGNLTLSGIVPVANGGTGISSLGTGVATALGVNVGSAGSPVVNGGVLGTPSSGVLTNATGLPLTTGVSGILPVANGGTGNAGGAWTTASPTATSETGSFTSVSTTAHYLIEGKKLIYTVLITITTAGTAAGKIFITLPGTTPATTGGVFSGGEAATQFACNAVVGGGSSTLAITKYDGTTIIGSGRFVLVSGTIEIQ